MLPDSPENQKNVFVSELKVGDEVRSAFVITSISLREYERGKFLSLRLGDATGKINAVLWDGAEEAARRLEEGNLVAIHGKVNSYQNEPQITIKSIRGIEDPTGLSPKDFLPVSTVPLETLVEEFDRVVAEVADEDYKRLLAVFRADAVLWNAYQHAPGAKNWHHPHLHGLLEHTLSVMKQCRLIAPFYPRVDSDLLLAGAVFHDLGKTEELVYDYRIDYSTDGRLLGHVFIGAEIAVRLMDRAEPFPKEKRRLLLHLILSHHGEVERSPILPMTLEACLLHHLENMDAQMAAIVREMNKARSAGNAWTGYVNLIDRFLYLGENP